MEQEEHELIDLTEVVGSKLTEDGVLAVTHGAAIGLNVRENLRGLLKHTDPDAYAKYRAIKYPDGEDSATRETRLAATRHLFNAVCDLLEPHYISAKELS
jgi:hypothetical protein